MFNSSYKFNIIIWKDPITKLDWDCSKTTYLVNEQLDCNLTIVGGSYLNISIDYNDGQIEEYKAIGKEYYNRYNIHKLLSK